MNKKLKYLKKILLSHEINLECFIRIKIYTILYGFKTINLLRTQLSLVPNNKINHILIVEMSNKCKPDSCLRTDVFQYAACL